MVFRSVFSSLFSVIRLLVGLGMLMVSLQGFSETTKGPHEPIEILVSIPPLAFIASDLAGEQANITLLSQNGSPHHRVLKPSDVSAMESADMTLWVGKEFEQYLTRFAARYDQKMLSLIELSPEATHIHADEAHDHGHHHGHSEHHREGVDPHIWLSPEAVLAYGKVITEQLSALQPENSTLFHSKYEAWQAKLNTAQRQWKGRLLVHESKPYFVYHEAYQYLEQVIGLESQAVLTVNPGVKPSARKLGELSRLLRNTDAACIFFEPEFQKVRLDRVTKAQLIYQQVDPIASTFKPEKRSEAQYVQFIDRLIGEFDQCLSQLQ